MSIPQSALEAFIENCWLLFQEAYLAQKGTKPPTGDAVKHKMSKFGWFLNAYHPSIQQLREYMQWLLSEQDNPKMGFNIGFAHVPSETMWKRFVQRSQEPTKQTTCSMITRIEELETIVAKLVMRLEAVGQILGDKLT